MPKKKRTDNQADAPGKSDAQTACDNAPGSHPDSDDKKIPIVGIGSSAGGLEALQEFFRAMPPESGMSFVVVTHQKPGHESVLADLLGRETAMKVSNIEDGMKPERDQVHVLAPGHALLIKQGAFRLMKHDSTQGAHMPIDIFFRSLANDQHENAIGLVLSGTGSDGALGSRELKANGGMVIAQQSASARYAGMPSAAAGTGVIDAICIPGEMPERLLKYIQGPYLQQRRTASAAGAVLDSAHIRKVLTIIRARIGHDFSSYKENTVRRRIERRMSVHALQNAEEYIDYLRSNAPEARMLFFELLISVTSFFRDPDAWGVLRHQALPALIRSRPDNHELRVWVPGCATGEEAYSVAMALAEATRELDKAPDIRVFATDLDDRAIELARRGVYPASIQADVSHERLDRFFTRGAEETYAVRKEIRDMLIFSVQNVLSDPPFMRLDLVVCRNLLIYLESDLQKKLLPTFHYTLNPDGLLFLGSSESISEFNDLFEALDNRWKIYRRKDAPQHIPDLYARSQRQTGPEEPVGQSFSVPAQSRGGAMARQIQRMLLDRFAPTAIIVDSQATIVYIHGRSGAYLEPEQQEPHNNVVDMAREGLRGPLSAAIHQVRDSREPVIRRSVRVKTNDHHTLVDFDTTLITEPEPIRGLILITLTPSSEARSLSANQPRSSDAVCPPDAEEQVSELERELRYTRESNQTAREELQTTNEELQSSNEELQSTNEELQSSKEELESLNEELNTVNNELSTKVQSLARAEDDLKNLLNSTDLAVLFVDSKLMVKRFTEKTRKLINLRDADIGRPLGDITGRIKYGDLLNDCRTVLDTLVRTEGEIRADDGAWYLIRILPYRTAENMIGGVVMTFIDISQTKDAQRLASDARVYFENIVNTVREPLMVLDNRLRIQTVNQSFCRTFTIDSEAVRNRMIYDLGNGQWDIPRLRELLESILPENASFENFEVEHDFPRIGRKKFILNARRMQSLEGMSESILLALEEMSA